MNELRVKRRWAPWWLAMVAAGFYILFSYGVVRAFVDPESLGPGIRIAIPAHLVAGYWVLAMLCNLRTALVTTDRVRVTIGPFPLGGSRFLDRGEIWLCYSRHVVTFDEGIEVANFYTTGVENGHGLHIDVSGPFKKGEDSLRAAYDIIRVLNDRPGRKPIEVRSGSFAFSDRKLKKQLMLWLAAFLLAIAVGGFWEIKSGTL